MVKSRLSSEGASRIHIGDTCDIDRYVGCCEEILFRWKGKGRTVLLTERDSTPGSISWQTWACLCRTLPGTAMLSPARKPGQAYRNDNFPIGTLNKMVSSCFQNRFRGSSTATGTCHDSCSQTEHHLPSACGSQP